MQRTSQAPRNLDFPAGGQPGPAWGEQVGAEPQVPVTSQGLFLTRNHVGTA